MAQVRDHVLPVIERHGPIRAWIIDDTKFPKKGRYSVGVARQYCGQLGKQDNCQVAVSLSLANEVASLPIAYQLYLPQAWAEDPERRCRTKVPSEVVFQTKPQIALDQIAAAKARGIAPGTILADAGYGADGDFPRRPVHAGAAYVVGVQPTLSVWRPGEGPLPPKPWAARGGRRPWCGVAPTKSRSRSRRSPKSSTPTRGTQSDGAKKPSGSLVTFCRRASGSCFQGPASRDYNRSEPRAEEWLMVEWPEDAAAPTNRDSQAALADRTRLSGSQTRPRLGSLRGSRMARLPSPCKPMHRSLRFPDRHSRDDSPSAPARARSSPSPHLSNDRRHRRSTGPARAARDDLHYDHAPTPHARSGSTPRSMSVLQSAKQSTSPHFMTQ